VPAQVAAQAGPAYPPPPAAANGGYYAQPPAAQQPNGTAYPYSTLAAPAAAGYPGAAYPQAALPPPPSYGQPTAAGPPPAAYGQVPGPLGGFMAGAAGGAEGPLAPALQALLATLANGSRQAADAHAEAAWKLEGRDLKVGGRCVRGCILHAWGRLCVSCACVHICCILCLGWFALGLGSGPANRRAARRRRAVGEGLASVDGQTTMLRAGGVTTPLSALVSSAVSCSDNVTKIRQATKAHQLSAEDRASKQWRLHFLVQNQALSGSRQVSTCGLENGSMSRSRACLAAYHIQPRLRKCGCIGFCSVQHAPYKANAGSRAHPSLDACLAHPAGLSVIVRNKLKCISSASRNSRCDGSALRSARVSSQGIAMSSLAFACAADKTLQASSSVC